MNPSALSSGSQLKLNWLKGVFANGWVACYLGPLLLVGMAIHQSYRVAAHGLTPWKGGGFAMFSTLDDQDYRQISIRLERADGTVVPADVEGRFTSGRNRLLFLPRHPMNSKLAEQLLKESWYLRQKDGETMACLRRPGRPVPGGQAQEGFCARAVMIDVFSMSFDRRTRKVEAQPIVTLSARSRDGE